MNYFREGKRAINQIKALVIFSLPLDDSGEHNEDATNEETDDQMTDDGMNISKYNCMSYYYSLNRSKCS